MSPSARYVDVQALAFAIVHALEDRDSGLRAEIDALRREVAAIADTLKSMQAQQTAPGTLAADAQDPAALSRLVAVLDERIENTRKAELSASLQETLRSDLTRLIERIETRSRADQVVALREEVRAQIGTLGRGGDLTGLREMLASELATLREQLRTTAAASAPAANGRTNGARATLTATEVETGALSLEDVGCLLQAVVQQGPDPDRTLTGLRERGYQRAAIKTGNPEVTLSPSSALLLGVADLLEEQDTP